MSVRSARWSGVCALVLVSAVACGKKGNPLPPLRPIPVGIRDLSAHSIDDRIELTMVAPAGNTDGSTPPAVTRVDLYAMTTAAGEAVPTAAGIIAAPASVRRQIAIAPPGDVAAASASAASRPPAPGDLIAITEQINQVMARSAGTPVAVHYVAVPVAGGGRGRPGAASDVVSVPLSARPSPPGGLTVTHDESRIQLRWEPAAPGQTFRVFAAARAGDVATPAELLTPTALQVNEFTVPVAFGVERCFSLRAIETTGRTTLESASTDAQCVTPVDRYPPPAPTRVETVQEGTAMTLIWAPVDAADLAGYIVLRAEEPGDRLQPLMRDPINQATYRDATVRSGASYVYAVIALDTVGNPSEQSSRQSVTVR